jgi:hypothetical protein
MYFCLDTPHHACRLVRGRRQYHPEHSGQGWLKLSEIILLSCKKITRGADSATQTDFLATLRFNNFLTPACSRQDNFNRPIVKIKKLVTFSPKST